MPIQTGTMGYSRFMVEGELLPYETIADRLNQFAFKPLRARGEDMETAGWCSYLSEYDWEKSIVLDDFLYDQNIILCMRIDKITPPNGLFRSLVKNALRDYAKNHHKIPDKTTKQEIKMAELMSLRSRMLPVTKVIESVWCQTTKEMRIFTRSKTLLDRFLELFQQTFLLSPERRDFASHSTQIAEGSQMKIELENLTHLPLFIPQSRLEVQ